MSAPVIPGGDSASVPERAQVRSRERPREISSAELLGPHSELTILHNEERYTLRITANRKLILTK